MLSDAERVRIKYHLGYTEASTAAGLVYGLPQPVQTLFLVENAMGKIPEAALGVVRDLIAKLDTTEEQLFQAQERFAASKLGEITLREDETDKLNESYKMWAFRLADVLGVPPYYYSTKLRGMMGGAGMIPAVH